MRRSGMMLCLALALCSMAFAQQFSVANKSGGVQIFKAGGAAWAPLTDSAAIGFGDSLSTDSSGIVTVKLSANTEVIAKGSTKLDFKGSGTDVTVTIVAGQLFLKRTKPYDLNSLSIISSGCTFSPTGTAAAIRCMKNGEASVAVIEGSMRMQSPTNEIVNVGSGKFGTFDPILSSVKSGALSDKAIKSLEDWSGAKFVSDSAAAAQATPVQVASADSAKPVETAPVISEPAPAASAAPAPAPAPEPTPAAPAPAPEATTPAAATSSTPATTEPAPPPSKKRAAASSSSPTAPPPSSAAPVAKADEKKEEKPKEAKPADGTKPRYEFGVSNVTVDNEQWTRIAFGVDIPVWKFGVFLDAELFVNSQGKFSNKGWNFTKDNWQESVLRKIRYIRFGHENEPLFIKFGGLQDVSLGYGFIVDRFTNMLHYPDQKLLGLQVYLNEISPVGITLQTMIADFYDFRNDGGVVAGRFALTPMKSTKIPLLNKLQIGATYATDLNQFAPARGWDYTLTGPLDDRDNDGKPDSTSQTYNWLRTHNYLTTQMRDSLIAAGLYDTSMQHPDFWASQATNRFSLLGIDAGIPLINSQVLRLDVYGQYGTRLDTVPGWGIGAPGVRLQVWKLMAQLEYRHVQGRFSPGYFNTYYLDERIVRSPKIKVKSQAIDSISLNGIFGNAALDISGVLTIRGMYQYLIGDNDTSSGLAALDQRMEASAGIGEKILGKIPKIKRVEAYFAKTDIGRSPMYDANGAPKLSGAKPVMDKMFEKTPTMYYGYRVGIGLTEGAVLIMDARYGWKHDMNNKLVPNNNISIETAITF